MPVIMFRLLSVLLLCSTSALADNISLDARQVPLAKVVLTQLISVPLAQSALDDSPPGLGVAGDFRFSELTERLFHLIEGNAGALIMVMAGIAALVSAVFGAYRAAISLLVVAVGAFVLRSLVEIFFDYTPM